MTRPTDEPRTTRRPVVFFDICSSTVILEDLLRTANAKRWRNLLIYLKRFLVSERDRKHFEVYKFLGDGWILIFDDGSFEGAEVLDLLQKLSAEYERLFEENISPVLTGNTHIVGLTFGIDEGELISILLDEKTEHIGRALNVAARLQGAVKQQDAAPQNKLLVSRNAYDRLALSGSEKYKAEEVTCALGNVSGGTAYRAMKISLNK